MMEVVSKTGKLLAEQEKVFDLISDFQNIARYVPPEKLENVQINGDEVIFEHPEQGKLVFQIEKKEPYKLIKYVGSLKDQSFYMYLQLKSVEAYDTRFRITLRAEVPSVLAWALKGKVQKMIDDMVDRIEKIYG